MKYNYKRLHLIILVFSLFSITYADNISMIKHAYNSNDLVSLVKIAGSGNSEDSKIAFEYITMLDFQEIPYESIVNALSCVPDNKQSLRNLLSGEKTIKELNVLMVIQEKTAEEIGKYYLSPQNESIYNELANNMSPALDSLSFLELKYLRFHLPFFRIPQLADQSKKKYGEVETNLKKNIEAYCKQENIFTKTFLSVLKYEIMDGLKSQFQILAKAHANDINPDEIIAQKLYDEFNKKLQQYWNADIINSYVQKKLPLLTDAINASRFEYLSKLQIETHKKFDLKPLKVSFKAAADGGVWGNIAGKRKKLKEKSDNVSLASFFLGFIPVVGTAISAGGSLYNGSQIKKAAAEEVELHQSALRNSYAKVEKQTKDILDKLTAEIEKNQKEQTGQFYNYVLENY